MHKITDISLQNVFRMYFSHFSSHDFFSFTSLTQPIATSNGGKPRNMCVPLCKYACHIAYKINHPPWYMVEQVELLIGMYTEWFISHTVYLLRVKKQTSHPFLFISSFFLWNIPFFAFTPISNRIKKESYIAFALGFLFPI